MAYKVYGTPINVSVTASSAAIAGLAGDTRYLCIATAATFLKVGGAAALNAGIYLPPNEPIVLKFESTDVRVIGTAGQYLHMVPVAEV